MIEADSVADVRAFVGESPAGLEALEGVALSLPALVPGRPAVAPDVRRRHARALAWMVLARGGEVDRARSVVYLQAVADVPPELLERASYALGRRPRGEFDPTVPSVGEILAAVAAARRDVAAEAAESAAALLSAPKSDDDGPRYCCLECSDAGLRVAWCAGRGANRRPAPVGPLAPAAVVPCGRLRDHAGHSYAEVCGCVNHNPVVARRRAAEAARAAARPVKRGRA